VRRTIRLPGDLRAPAAARSFLSRELGGVDSVPPDGVPDVVLVASELVTNAVQAGAGVVDVELAVDGGRIDLTVADDANGFPTEREAPLDAIGGRGLHIVAAYSDAWASRPRERGKEVTATWYPVG
jgi:two-component sensor histidine kinase